MGTFNWHFYHNRRVFITGHTGFKGTWLTFLLLMLGADVTGFSSGFPTREGEALFNALQLSAHIRDLRGDVRDLKALQKALVTSKPEIVLHLAAQPLVLASYEDPVTTYTTNVMGTVHLLEAVRRTKEVCSVLNITTDKVYENKEWAWGYRENEPLDGYDPYSNSKSCAELVTHSYVKSFFKDGPAVSTMRAGNVIGGGDFSKNRIVPDCIRSALCHKVIRLRSPNSTRPYQHVLEPLCAYLILAGAQMEKPKLSGWYNVGPEDCDCVTTGQLATLFCDIWGEDVRWESTYVNTPHEANFLKLDSTKLKTMLSWSPRWHVHKAVEETIAWAKAYVRGEDISAVMKHQITTFMGTEHI